MMITPKIARSSFRTTTDGFLLNYSAIFCIKLLYEQIVFILWPKHVSLSGTALTKARAWLRLKLTNG